MGSEVGSRCGIGEAIPATVEAWALAYLRSTDLGHKLAPPAPPRAWEDAPPVRRMIRPGRPAELRPANRARRSPKPSGLHEPRLRARILATLHHHELQAAELFLWALLAFPDTPRRFRQGLVAMAMEELVHARLYRERLEAQGAQLRDFEVRDWFWERVPTCPDATAYVALVGLGLEGGNLEHAARYARAFEVGGDPETAAVCRRVADDEERHVRFAARWFRRFTGRLDFASWRAALPPPLTPSVLASLPLAREARSRSGQDQAFLDELEAWCRARPGS